MGKQKEETSLSPSPSPRPPGLDPDLTTDRPEPEWTLEPLGLPGAKNRFTFATTPVEPVPSPPTVLTTTEVDVGGINPLTPRGGPPVDPPLPVSCTRYTLCTPDTQVTVQNFSPQTHYGCRLLFCLVGSTTSAVG